MTKTQMQKTVSVLSNNSLPFFQMITVSTFLTFENVCMSEVDCDRSIVAC